MAITINQTLPNEWQSSTTYYEGDKVTFASIIYRCKQTSTNNRPDTSPDYWKPLDIYLKDESVMEIGDYSGDENFWERDHIYIDSGGWVYVNNENTGINVTGPPGSLTVDFDELTPAQLEQIRGPQGNIGPQGPQGIQGIQGPPGEVTLTEEQIEVLKGDPGKSAYDIWLENGHTGTEQDFLTWLQEGIITLDEELDPDSTHGVENKAIYAAYNDLYNTVNALIGQFDSRIADIENRLQYEYNGEMQYFKFGVTTSGAYGYIPTNTSTIIPFNQTDRNNLSTNFTEGTTSIFYNNLGISSANSPANMTIQSLESSIQDTPSTSETTENNVVYGTNTSNITFAEMFNVYTAIYEQNVLYDDTHSFYTYNMNFDFQTIEGVTRPVLLSSKGISAVEGIWFTPGVILGLNNEICIEVEPVVEGTTISCEIGNFTSGATLPTIVSAGTGRVNYNTYTFNQRTIFTFPLVSSLGIFFSTTAIGQYKITKIYSD